MKKLIRSLPGIFILLGAQHIFTADILYAQYVMGAKHLALGQTSVAIPSSNWAVFSNASLMPTFDNHVSFYGFRYAGISEITDMAVAYSQQTSLGTFGAGVHRYGFNLFSKNRFLIGYKNNLGKFHYGGSISYTHVLQGGSYGSAGATGIDIGISAEIITGLWFGARATNINQSSYGDTDESLPRDLSAGISYQLASQVQFVSEIVKDILFPVSFRTGVQVEVIKSIFTRAGITTQPETYSLGFGYITDRLEVNIALQQHNPLGLSPAIDFGIRF